MQKQLTKGNEAIVKAAVLAGCRAYYGYPITPASEIAEAAALYLPQAGGVFIQAESEVAAINMLKGGGHGNYRTLVLAPDSAQEMADLTIRAFDLADEYRNPVVVLADGFIGQMMEPVEFPAPRPVPPPPAWAVTGNAATRPNLISSIYLEPDALERHIRKLEDKYRRAEREAAAAECWRTEDAEFLLVGYGIVGRILKSVVEMGRARGIPLGLFRPITLYPFPAAR